MTKEWIECALQCLESSLKPIPHELNELDWKCDISEKGDQLAKHISAFANYTRGGFMVFGISDQGEIIGTNQEQIKKIISKLGSIARNNVEPQVCIDHTIQTVEEKDILLIYIKESGEKPVHIKGRLEESYLRSGASSKQMSKKEIGWSLISSKIPSYEEQIAYSSTDPQDVLDKLEYTTYFRLLDKPVPSEQGNLIDSLSAQGLLSVNDGNYNITNLGALLAAKDFNIFNGHARRGIRVIFYSGNSRINSTRDITGKRGYAVGFESIIDFILSNLPRNEIIDKAFREEVPLYPKVAIRELLANALIHQDFSIDAFNPKIEIFSDRIEITNPGSLIPKTSIDRIIGINMPRNELLARKMYKLRVCEDRGSGFTRTLTALEVFGLPPLKFNYTETTFTVTMFAPRSYQDMSNEEREDACYQHCVLKYLSNDKMTNSSLRERLRISERNYSMASRIIKGALEADRIRVGNPEMSNPKYIYYVPYYVRPN